MAEIEENITNNTEDNLWLYKKELQQIIEDNIVSRYCYNEGGVAHSLPTDKGVAKAVEVLLDTEQYATILSQKDTDKK